MNPRLVAILTLVAIIGRITTIPEASAFAIPTFDLTASPPCACSTSAIYTFHIENPEDIPVAGITVTIPAGYAVNPAYLTTTAGIVVATGVGGDVFPRTTDVTVEIKTTTTSGVFEMFLNGISQGLTGTLTLPTQTTPGTWVAMFPAVGPNTWGEVSFVAGFITNPCTVGTYNWSPNTAMMRVGEQQIEVVQMNPRNGYSNAVTIVNCAVGGVVAPTNKLEILTPYLALAGLVAVASTVVIARRRREA